jgi:hypothetical protein
MRSQSVNGIRSCFRSVGGWARLNVCDLSRIAQNARRAQTGPNVVHRLSLQDQLNTVRWVLVIVATPGHQPDPHRSIAREGRGRDFSLFSEPCPESPRMSELYLEVEDPIAFGRNQASVHEGFHVMVGRAGGKPSPQDPGDLVRLRIVQPRELRCGVALLENRWVDSDSFGFHRDTKDGSDRGHGSDAVSQRVRRHHNRIVIL